MRRSPDLIVQVDGSDSTAGEAVSPPSPCRVGHVLLVLAPSTHLTPVEGFLADLLVCSEPRDMDLPRIALQAVPRAHEKTQARDEFAWVAVRLSRRTAVCQRRHDELYRIASITHTIVISRDGRILIPRAKISKQNSGARKENTQQVGAAGCSERDGRQTDRILLAGPVLSNSYGLGVADLNVGV